MRGGPVWVYMIGLVSLFLATIRYEAGLLVLSFLPGVVFLLERNFSRRRWIGMGVWYGILSISILYFLLPLFGFTGDSYSTSILYDVTPTGIISRLSYQINAAFYDMIFPLVPADQRIRVVVLIGVGVFAFCMILTSLISNNTTQFYDGVESEDKMFYLAMFGAGVTGTILSIAPYLPTWYGQYADRVHLVAAPFEALTIISILWLATSFAQIKHLTILRTIMVLVIVLSSSSNRLQLQDALSGFNMTWQDQTIFFRSLANQIPFTKDGTLILYQFDPSNIEAGQSNGSNFAYGARYLYHDQTMAASDIGYWNHELLIDDIGITITGLPQRGFEMVELADGNYKWEQIIVIDASPDGTVIVLEELPEDLYTDVRALQYDPQSLIVRTEYIPERFTRFITPLQPID